MPCYNIYCIKTKLLSYKECATPLPFIVNGYRQDMPIKETIISSLTCHNETCNIWTHFIPFVVSLVLIVKEYLNKSRYHLDTYVIVIYCLCMAFTFFTSFMYHLFCNKIKWEPFLLQLDFIGILVLLWGSNLPMLYFGYSCKPIQRYLFFGIETGMIILIMGVLMFQTKFNKFRFIFFIGIVFIGLIQAINEYFIHLPIYSRSLLVIKLYTQSLSFYGFGTFIYLFKVPERFWSGKFDYIGNSHNYWHIFVILGAFIQYNNCLIYQEQITNCNNN